MKRLIILVLSLVLAWSLIGCDNLLTDDGYGKLIVEQEIEIDRGADYDDLPSSGAEIEDVIIRGDMNDWGEWDDNEDIKLEETAIGVWKLPAEYLLEIKAGDKYQFLYQTAESEEPEIFLADNLVVEEDKERLTFNFAEFYPKYFERIISVSEDAKVTVGEQEGELGEEISLAEGSYEVTVMDDIYGSLKQVNITTGETTQLRLSEPLELAQAEISFEFDPNEYDQYQEGHEVAIFGDPSGWKDGFGDSDYLLEWNDAEGLYQIKLTATAGDNYEFAIMDDWSEVPPEDDGWDAFTRVVPQDTDETAENDYGDEQGVVSFSRIMDAQ